MGKYIKVISALLAISLLWQQVIFAAPVDYAKLRALAYAERQTASEGRRPWQYSLRTLLLSVTAVAVLMGTCRSIVPMPGAGDTVTQVEAKYRRLRDWLRPINTDWSNYFEGKRNLYLYGAMLAKPEIAKYGKNADVNFFRFSRGQPYGIISVLGMLGSTDVGDTFSSDFVNGDFIGVLTPDGEWLFYDPETLEPRTDVKRIVLAERQSEVTGIVVETTFSGDGKAVTSKEVTHYKHHLEFREYFCDLNTAPADNEQGIIMSFKGPDGEQKVLVKFNKAKATVAITAGTFGPAQYTEFWGLKEGEYSVFDPVVSELLDAAKTEAKLDKDCTVIPAGFDYKPQWVRDQYKPEPAPEYFDFILDYLDRIQTAKGKVLVEPVAPILPSTIFGEQRVISNTVLSSI